MFKRMMEDTLLKTLGASDLLYLLIVGFTVTCPNIYY